MIVGIRRAQGIDEPIVQRVIESAPTYFLRTDRSPVLPHFARREMSDGPPMEKQSSTYEKIFCLAYVDGVPAGVIDIHRDHPERGISYIGLLLIEESRHGKGLGRKVYEATEQFITANVGPTTIRLGVSRDNDVEAFWLKLGFVRNGRTYLSQGESHVNQVFEMEKKIQPNQAAP